MSDGLCCCGGDSVCWMLVLSCVLIIVVLVCMRMELCVCVMLLCGLNVWMLIDVGMW